MPSGITLDELVVSLRAEIGDSTNPSMGLDSLPGLRQTLRRVQETYHEDFDWPQLVINRDEVIPAGERFFTFNADVDFLRIFSAHVRDGGKWVPLAPGITADNYNQSDPDNGDTGTPARWDHYEENQFEIWPTPAAATIVRFRSIRTLAPLVAGADRCTLDSNLIVLTAAAELLARAKAEDASLKLAMATAHYNRLKGRAMKTRTFTMIPGRDTCHQPSRITVPR